MIDAVETYREFICPKCGCEFEDPNPQKEYDAGIMCPECPGPLKGVISPVVRNRLIAQDQWDKAVAQNNLYRSQVNEAIAILEGGTEYERMHVASILRVAVDG